MEVEHGGERSWFAARLDHMLSPLAPHGRLTFAVLVSMSLLSASAPSARAFQKEGRGERPEVDPYTEGEPEAMAAAGYVRFGPFLWAEEHTTEVAEETIGGVPILWVETEHFKIGSSLDAYKLTPDQKEKKKIQGEIKRLKKRLKGLSGKVKTLDPWLRLHLWAMRLEDLYASFCTEFGLTDDMFPAPEGTAPAGRNGAYLGMRDKFCVLLVEKQSSLARYTSTYCSVGVDTTIRHHFPKTDTLFYGMANDSLEGLFKNDSAMHYSVAFNVSQNLSNGYRGYTHEAPLWWNLGLARWFARQADSRWLLYCASNTAAVEFDEKDSHWEVRVRKRVDTENSVPMAELNAFTQFSELDEAAHMMIWSRVDYLMRLDTGQKQEWLREMQSDDTWRAAAGGGGALATHCAEKLSQVLGMDCPEFDRRWSSFVEKEYPRK